MAFDLRVEFSGPTLFILDTDAGGDTREATVLMPDARRSRHPDPKHLDGKDATNHVGYIRLNLGDLNASYPRGKERDQPRYELVHRFDGQMLEFVDIPAGPMDAKHLHFPRFGKFTRDLEIKPRLLGANPSDELLMRTTLRGGTFTSTPKRFWAFSTVLNPGERPYVDEFAASVAWTRRIEATHFTIRVTDFRGNVEASFPFEAVPEGATVKIEIGNMCAVNPLDWGDLPTHIVDDMDGDFKWLYGLLRSKGMSGVKLPTGGELPAPRLLRQGGPETGEEACMGGVYP